MLVFKELNPSSFSRGRGIKFSPLPVDLHAKGRFQSFTQKEKQLRQKGAIREGKLSKEQLKEFYAAITALRDVTFLLALRSVSNWYLFYASAELKLSVFLKHVMSNLLSVCI